MSYNYVSYKYRKKCRRCGDYFSVNHAGRLMCDKCTKKKSKNGGKMKQNKKTSLQVNNPKGYNKVKKAPKKVNAEVVIKEENNNLMVNNSDGFNRYKKNPNPIEPVKNQLQTFTEKSDMEQKELIGKLGNELYMLKRDIRPLLMRFNKFKDYYERKHFGWNWEDT